MKQTLRLNMAEKKDLIRALLIYCMYCDYKMWSLIEESQQNWVTVVSLFNTNLHYSTNLQLKDT